MSSPLTIDEVIDIHERVAQLVQDSQLQQAVHVLEEAVDRAGHDATLALEMRIELATTLYVADEFTRAAAIFDAVLPAMAGRDDVALYRYYAGVSHAEAGEIGAAIDYLSAFLANADPADSLYRDAKYQLGMMLPSVGRTAEGMRHLEDLRPLLASEYGEDSVHVRTLDRRLDQIRRGLSSSA